VHRIALALGIVLLAPTLVRADVVVTTDGRRIEGTVSEREGKIVVKRRGVEILIDKAEVAKIESDTGERDELAKKRAALAPDDAAGRYALALWCKERGLGAEWRELLNETIKVDPDHVQARRDLGFVKDQGQWIQEDDLRRKLGQEKVDGRWMPAAEAKRARRSGEVRKLLVRVSLNLSKNGPRGEQAQKELDGLLSDDPVLVAPLVEERLGEHDAGVRLAMVELLGKLKVKSTAPKLIELVFGDEDRAVREAAAVALWATGDVAGRTQVVQSLYHQKQTVRDLAADALKAANDPETFPYLVEALYLRGLKTVADVEPGVSRGGFGTVRAQGVFGGYNAPSMVSAGEVPTTVVETFLYSHKVLNALKKITGRDFDFSKHDWWKWWEKEGRAKLLPNAPAPGATPTGK
jgi:hypothetical protein